MFLVAIIRTLDDTVNVIIRLVYRVSGITFIKKNRTLVNIQEITVFYSKSTVGPLQIWLKQQQ